MATHGKMVMRCCLVFMGCAQERGDFMYRSGTDPRAILGIVVDCEGSKDMADVNMTIGGDWLAVPVPDRQPSPR